MWKARVLKKTDICDRNAGDTQGLEMIHLEFTFFCSKAFMLQMNSEFLVSAFGVEPNKFLQLKRARIKHEYYIPDRT